MDLNRPSWMRDCATCTTLADAVDAAAGMPYAELGELEQHLVEAHLAQLPPYDETCPNCVEWMAIQGDPGESLARRYGGRVVPILGHEDLLHRAGHLVQPLAHS